MATWTLCVPCVWLGYSDGADLTAPPSRCAPGDSKGPPAILQLAKTAQHGWRTCRFYGDFLYAKKDRPGTKVLGSCGNQKGPYEPKDRPLYPKVGHSP